MDNTSHLLVLVEQCRFGMLQRRSFSIPTVDIPVQYRLSHGLLMGSASPRGVMIAQCKSGMPSPGVMSLPIMAILMLCVLWHGHPMEGVLFQVGTIRQHRFGMQAMEAKSSSIEGTGIV